MRHPKTIKHKGATYRLAVLEGYENRERLDKYTTALLRLMGLTEGLGSHDPADEEASVEYMEALDDNSAYDGATYTTLADLADDLATRLREMSQGVTARTARRDIDPYSPAEESIEFFGDLEETQVRLEEAISTVEATDAEAADDSYRAELENLRFMHRGLSSMLDQFKQQGGWRAG